MLKNKDYLRRAWLRVLLLTTNLMMGSAGAFAEPFHYNGLTFSLDAQGISLLDYVERNFSRNGQKRPLFRPDSFGGEIQYFSMRADERQHRTSSEFRHLDLGLNHAEISQIAKQISRHFIWREYSPQELSDVKPDMQRVKQFLADHRDLLDQVFISSDLDHRIYPTEIVSALYILGLQSEPAHFQVYVGVSYKREKQSLGELDLVFVDKRNQKVVAIGEVKSGDDSPTKQLNRIRENIDRNFPKCAGEFSHSLPFYLK